MNLKEMFGEINEKDLEISRKVAKVSRILMDERYKKNLNQTEFGKILGVSQPMVSKIESFDYNPTIKTLFEISDKIGLDLDICVKPKYFKSICTNTKVNFSEEELNNLIKQFSEMLYKDTSHESQTKIINMNHWKGLRKSKITSFKKVDTNCYPIGV